MTVPPLTLNAAPVAPESAPVPSASVPVMPVRLTLLVPPSEIGRRSEAAPANAPVERISAWPLASIVALLRVSVPKLVPVRPCRRAACRDDVDAGDLVLPRGQGHGEAAALPVIVERAPASARVEAGDDQGGAGADQMLARLA